MHRIAVAMLVAIGCSNGPKKDVAIPVDTPLMARVPVDTSLLLSDAAPRPRAPDSSAGGSASAADEEDDGRAASSGTTTGGDARDSERDTGRRGRGGKKAKKGRKH